MNVRAYLNRIGIDYQPTVDIGFLTYLHQQHVLTIPFENLDIGLGEIIYLELNHLFNKVITRNRGGFCYELNYLFYKLLRSIGFSCQMVEARIYKESGHLGPPYDHLCIVVNLQDRYLVDVGYGDLFIQPLLLSPGKTVVGWFDSYSIESNTDNGYILSKTNDQNVFVKIYQFDLTPRKIEDFQKQCTLKQIHPDSYFVQNTICTMPTKNGRITLFNDTLTRTVKGKKIKNFIQSKEVCHKLLKEHFNIALPPS